MPTKGFFIGWAGGFSAAIAILLITGISGFFAPFIIGFICTIVGIQIGVRFEGKGFVNYD